MLKQELNLKLQQKISPMQIQVIKMLEYPTIEMEERIRDEIESNPALEEGHDEDEPHAEAAEAEINKDENGDDLSFDDMSYDDYNPDDEIPDYKLYNDNSSPDVIHESVVLSGHQSFHEHLVEQLKLDDIDDLEMKLAEYIIGNIDEDGYLRRSIEAMSDDLAFQLGLLVTPAQMQTALQAVQKLDPAGVGASTLQECLLLQLQRKTKTPEVDMAIRVIDRYFLMFTKKQYDTIAVRMNLSDDEMRDVLDEILKLNPKPGNALGSGAETLAERITPDFIVENENGLLYVTLNNSNIPELRVNPQYNRMLKDFMGNSANRTRQTKDAILFARQKIDAARWFIDAIKQRNTTMLQTMNAILATQYEFFLSGDEKMLKPMKLKDISDVVGYDVSTISRVSNSKYVQTEFGIYPLKYFFSESMQTQEGEVISNKEIKKIISEIVEQEDKQCPITDDILTAQLHDMGYIIARRTVAKYREQMGIPVARLRTQNI